MTTADDITGSGTTATDGPSETDRQETDRQEEAEANTIRLRTLIRLRWSAVAGQSAAVAVAMLVFGLQLPLQFVLVTIFASFTTTLMMVLVYPPNRRLSEEEAMFGLGFDICQLALLLALTGGLNNPFALLLLAPVAISASVLGPRATALVCGLAVVLILAIGVLFVPMRWPDGTALLLPPLFRFGFELALVIGAVFVAVYARLVTSEIATMRQALTATQLALVREQKMTDLGGVIAAAAHELGTPLATIKLAAAELRDELADNPEAQEDAALIVAQADRCRDILRSMGRAGKHDMQMRRAPIAEVLREAAEPHLGRGREVRIEAAPETGGTRDPLEIWRKPEIVHGLRNLIQNAVDFAAEEVVLNASWTADRVQITISDDGPGFPDSIVERIGAPFIRRRRQAENERARPDYEGMGLGLFIAKTLLERTGATLAFANRRNGTGALVTLSWPRDEVEPPRGSRRLGENRLILP